MKVAAPLLANLLSFAAYQGIPEKSLTALLSNKEMDLCDPECFISGEEYLQIFSNALNQSQKEDFGLRFGQFLNLNALGLVLQISLNSSSIQQAIVYLQNYLRSQFPFVELTTFEDAPFFVLQIQSNIQSKKLSRQLIELSFCIMYRELSLMLLKDSVLRLSLPAVQPYNHFFKTEISIGSNYQILLDKKLLYSEINQKRMKDIESVLPQFVMMLL